ncbi:DUF6869 domain-containing protein [Lacimonas salitolerans]|uniref:DUF6869 domain-containing protein n=1 Tax=Lacimonas salitolerans TaxID=1323750 RepID=A0ABW4EFR5_9RHOB
MSDIPRSLVAQLLDVSPETLPAGDLPADRLAHHLLTYLRDTAADDPSEQALRTHPQAWAMALTDRLCADHPDTGLDLTLAALPLCDSPDDVAMLAAGPLEDLLATHGPALIDRIETLGPTTPRLRFALSGTWPDRINPLVWARVQAARDPGPDLDAGDPLPPA